MVGFMVIQEEKPIGMSLSDDIVAGLQIEDPFPIFASEDDAREKHS